MSKQPVVAENDPRIPALIDMLGRTGAREFQLRFSDDEVPVIWMAAARWKNHWEAAGATTPYLAMFRLAESVMDGGECTHCHKPTGIDDRLERDPLMEASEVMFCWYRWDPENKTFRRSRERRGPMKHRPLRRDETSPDVCGAIGPPPPRLESSRKLCNRIPHHEGPHRHYCAVTLRGRRRVVRRHPGEGSPPLEAAVTKTPATQLSLKYLRNEGWMVEVVERYTPNYTGEYGGKRHDLFGMFDLIALRGGVTLVVQTTSYSNINARLNKIRDPDHADALAMVRAAGWQIRCHGWTKAHRTTKVVCTHTERCGCIYTLRRDIDLTTEDP